MGGQIQGRLLFRNDDEKARARKAGIEDLNVKYDKDDMCRSDVIFAATGVTNGSIVRGARRVGPYLETETILMRSQDRLGAPAALPHAQPLRAGATALDPGTSAH